MGRTQRSPRCQAMGVRKGCRAPTEPYHRSHQLLAGRRRQALACRSEGEVPGLRVYWLMKHRKEHTNRILPCRLDNAKHREVARQWNNFIRIRIALHGIDLHLLSRTSCLVLASRNGKDSIAAEVRWCIFSPLLFRRHAHDHFVDQLRTAHHKIPTTEVAHFYGRFCT